MVANRLSSYQYRDKIICFGRISSCASIYMCVYRLLLIIRPVEQNNYRPQQQCNIQNLTFGIQKKKSKRTDNKLFSRRVDYCIGSSVLECCSLIRSEQIKGDRGKALTHVPLIHNQPVWILCNLDLCNKPLS